MLSTFAVRSGVFANAALRTQAPRVLAVVPVGSRGKSKAAQQADQWEEANKIFYGPERDTKNFPHPVMPQESGKVRLGFVPEEWFQFFYTKTGVTGPYLFGVGLVTTLLSKEIWVVDHGFAEVLGFFGAVWLLTNKLGPKMAKWMDTKNDAVTQERFVKPVEDAKTSAHEIVKSNETAIWQEEGQKYLWEAKRENVALQLEAAYRKRLNEVYKEVKNRLDYQLEVQNVKRRFEQDHMVNWIVSNVRKNITPQQEQESIKVCIAQLKKMSAATA
ncbi:ATP synthase subunit b, mitochondrial-like [Babylonia areolata]|uniref:ATP synthase subunit b, mitochondrial-like n=1 Tax=Babylonia areolata TaxID=304850 RepID=UPI003FD2472B